jgi:hypothetical protein
MVHSTMGETISSYKRLMHNPATAETWQTASGKDFGGMAQGDNKTGQKGTNSIRNDSRRDPEYSQRQNGYLCQCRC